MAKRTSMNTLSQLISNLVDQGVKFAKDKNEQPRKNQPSKKKSKSKKRKKKEDSELTFLKNKLKPIVDLANARWTKLDELNLRSLAISRAYEESNDRWGFNLDMQKDKYDIIAEATRARVFLNDRTSTIEGARMYTEQESYLAYKGKFGGQYKNWENKFKGFDTSVISEQEARAAFAAYRRLEESEAARIQTYGSENTIIAIYDMAIKNGFYDSENIDDITDLTEMARDMLSREIGEKRAQFDAAFAKENEVTYLLDTIKLDYLEREW